jgi:RNA polymerase sigma-70 factor (ECF subfamily)
VEEPDPRSRAEDRETADLVARFQSGDSAAFDLIYRRFAPGVNAVARRIVRDPHEAEDVTQEVFAAALRVLPGFRSRQGGLGGWLSVTARNLALTHLRRQRRSEVTAPDRVDLLVESLSLGGAGEELLHLSEGEVWRLVAKLPAFQQEVLELRFRHDLSPVEIARRLGRSVGAVDQAQRRALATLRRRVEHRRRPPPGRRDQHPFSRICWTGLEGMCGRKVFVGTAALRAMSR